MKKINSTLFKQTMGKFVTGVTIVTIKKNNNFIGKTINSFASLSQNPPLVLFSLDKKSTSLNSFLETSFLGINILSKSQKNLSIHFSKKNPIWGKTNFFLTNNDVPMIKNSIANICCKKIENIKKGDHIIFICKILKINYQNNLKPLIYSNSKYL